MLLQLQCILIIESSGFGAREYVHVYFFAKGCLKESAVQTTLLGALLWAAT